jgi:hypothetical protein
VESAFAGDVGAAGSGTELGRVVGIEKRKGVD